jgi:hypothetical protein
MSVLSDLLVIVVILITVFLAITLVIHLLPLLILVVLVLLVVLDLVFPKSSLTTDCVLVSRCKGGPNETGRSVVEGFT